MDTLAILKTLYELTIGFGFIGKIIKRNGIEKRLRQDGYVHNTYVGKYARKTLLDLLLGSLVPIYNISDLVKIITDGIDKIYIKYRDDGKSIGAIIEKEKYTPGRYKKSFEEMFDETFPRESSATIQKVDYKPQNKGEDTDEKDKGPYKK